MFDYLLEMLYYLVMINSDQQHVNKYSMLQYMLNQVHLHNRARLLELMLPLLESVVKNVFVVASVELSEQNPNQEFPKIKHINQIICLFRYLQLVTRKMILRI
jgi:hypothetical protein